MPLRMFSDKTPWDEARKDTRSTAAALEASDEHGALAKPLRALLGQWKALETEREDTDDAMVDANAIIRRLDAMLDREVNNLAAQLLVENNRDTSAAGFRRFFPEAPSEVVRLGLASEIERTGKFDKVASELGASKEVKAILKRIEGLRTRGTPALQGREKVAETRGRVSLRISVWKDDANHARRSIYAALEQYAVENRLPRGYADEFFPVGRSTKKASESAGEPEST
ncbi:MAG: hypothetical protein R3B70_21230 [Polyangiaceae bacterium]